MKPPLSISLPPLSLSLFSLSPLPNLGWKWSNEWCFLPSFPQVWMEDYRMIDSLEQIELFITWENSNYSAIEVLESGEWIELKRIELFIIWEIRTIYYLRNSNYLFSSWEPRRLRVNRARANRTIFSNYLLLEKTRIIYAVVLQKELSGGHCAGWTTSVPAEQNAVWVVIPGSQGQAPAGNKILQSSSPSAFSSWLIKLSTSCASANDRAHSPPTRQKIPAIIFRAYISTEAQPRSIWRGK